MRMRRSFFSRSFKSKLKYFLVVFVLGFAYVFGVFTHIFEKDYYSDFSYPLEGDIVKYAYQLRYYKKPDTGPINEYNFSYLYNAKGKCTMPDKEKIRLVIIVKSAIKHFKRRLVIRHSWGYEGRFSDVPVRTVFILGVGGDENLQHEVALENETFGDIVQANFTDNYYNNTIKTMMGFKWAVLYCPNAMFYFFSDDDMYVSTKNILRFVRNPINYPAYLQQAIVSLNTSHSLPKIFDHVGREPLLLEEDHISNRKLQQVLDYQLPENVSLYSGYVFVSSPHRHLTSKWCVSLEEYPYHMWPPYIAAGAYVMSHEALFSLYYGSLFTKQFSLP
ncbi:beta-1,3-galactosyltransferase brn [Nilaparvata lugens]|uniref:beta-1,3-galactosyltransferase brn n=1 Tax=Nilaparvata lugens TaxID=108931 RepID=UPI00193DB697|nr:beta-1,3-galactosyltransferase brn [Nilaparvata lugens]